MTNYYYDKDAFVVKNFNQQSPFANFLPGVAGRMGIPLWAFYVNRGQGISGYGLQDKNHPIMAFTPANKAYETTPITGFRTFIKTNNMVYEPFKVDSPYPHKMTINYTSFTIEEENTDLKLKTKITYFGLPNEPLAALVRKVEITNLANVEQSIELLDGIAEILPSGIQNASFKMTSNLLASWADVKHLDTHLPYFTLRASTGDTSEVKTVDDGNFYFGFTDDELLKPIVDTSLVFGYNTAKTVPQGLIENSLTSLESKDQVTTNVFASAFLPKSMTLKSKETLTIHALSGHAASFDIVKAFAPKIMTPGVIDAKYAEAIETVQTLLNDVETHTAKPIFDAYIKQNYLDNLLRGGYPEKIGNTIYHLYARRHGDLERDYNFFSLAPEYFSTGSGNFRDVCQNRRIDTFINKDVEDFNVHHFASLIGLDGYNPLSVNGIAFTLKTTVDADTFINNLFTNKHAEIKTFLNNPFTPGTLVNFIEANAIESRVKQDVYLNDIIEHSDASIQAAFGEGYWVDHFTYILDLVESYESIYPDRMKSILYERTDYHYFDSPVTLRPKREKLIVKNTKDVRQYGSLRHFDQEKIDRLGLNPNGPNWVKLNDDYYTSNLFTKLFILTMNKHSQLDPDGIGVEMEAEKPGWNDAMNGLPGLLGSGVSESIETLRIVDFLLDHIANGPLTVPVEVETLFNGLKTMPTYETRIDIRETYRDAIRFGLQGHLKTITIHDVKGYLESLKAELSHNIEQLFDEYKTVIPTFLRYDVTKYKPLDDVKGNHVYHNGYKRVKATTYQRHALTPFLEAPARLLKTSFNKIKLQEMHQTINNSDLYDKALNMYKTSGCLNNESHEIGRIHAFTKGWLERESNFLHMTYKYLLGLLKAGLYKEYYNAIETNLVCNMDPEVYKRSTLENSSFIATSNNPNKALQGKGFFARLSGSTVETLNMWAIMMTGGQPFKYQDGTLQLVFEPKLDKDYFKEDLTVDFTFLKDIKVTYVNASRDHTYERCDIYKIELIKEGTVKTINASIIEGALAEAIRDGLYDSIIIYMNKNKEEK